MDSPLALLETGEYTGAVLTTFTIDLTFIDRWVLPRLAHAGVRNIVVLCDDIQLAAELSQGATRARRATRSGCGVRRRLPPKIIYLSGPEKQIACVSPQSHSVRATSQSRDRSSNRKRRGRASTSPVKVASFQWNSQRISHQTLLSHSSRFFNILIRGGKRARAACVCYNLHEPIGPRLPGGPTIATSPFASRSAGIRLARTEN